MSPRLRVGNVVRVSDGHVLAGKEGILIAKALIPMYENGMLNFPDNPIKVDAKDVGVKQEDGTVFVIPMGQLTKLSED